MTFVPHDPDNPDGLPDEDEPEAPEGDDGSDYLLSAKEVASIIGVQEVTLYKWRRDGKGPAFYRLANEGGVRPRIRYRKSEILRYLAESRVEAWR